MRRALTILKYLPAVLCGLLVVAWVVSEFVTVGVTVSAGTNGVASINCYGGCLLLVFSAKEEQAGVNVFPRCQYSWHWVGVAGNVKYVNGSTANYIPIPALLTLLLPLAIGLFNRFRFPLWSWFAFTALVAVELAYYLR